MRFIILACDGLWKSFGSAEAINYVNELLKNSAKNEMYENIIEFHSRITLYALIIKYVVTNYDRNSKAFLNADTLVTFCDEDSGEKPSYGYLNSNKLLFMPLTH
ncbi:hypothetical protein DICVIV_01890 [Dictyocaulus viviparus]|uniref:PPM-type phosphatase domain-containing protein n=1 Tax=Dictyocaulus viviparus TaxID=29172 RepID=A0A0D8Y7G0_DICVI|nr:hypothetical protein DICVIV_01890 [Dictyocaulus viviparus]